MNPRILLLSIVLSSLSACNTDEGTKVIVAEKPSECFDQDFFTETNFRGFRMGFSTWNYGPDLDDIDGTYAFISANADIYSEQIDDVIPWQSLITGEPLPERFVNTINKKVSRRISNHQLLLSSSLLNTGRNDLMEGFNGEVPSYTRLDDEHIASAYIAHLIYLIDRFKPDYMILSMEANDLYINVPSKWAEYTSLMSNVRMEIKKLYPALQVSESMTLHNWFEPDIPDPELFIQTIKDYVANQDFVSVSFYPFFKGMNNQNQYQEAFDFLHKQTQKSIAFVETAHLAESLFVPSIDLSISADDCQQNDYLETLIGNAQGHDYDFIIWWTHRDYDELWATFPDNLKEIGSLWRDTGLINEKGNKRPSMLTWEAVFNQGK